MNCRNCQLKLSEATEFCPRCGASCVVVEKPEDPPVGSGYAGVIGILIVAILITLAVRSVRHSQALLITFGLHIVIVILHLTPYILIGMWRKARIEEIGLFFGPAVVRLQVGAWR